MAPPPLIYCGAVALGLLLELAWRFTTGASAASAWAGVTLIALGTGLAGAAARRFRSAGTNLDPGRPATALVTTGIYRFSRNPIYCGMASICAGIALVTADPWILLLSAGAVATVHYGVILREEEYLTRVFGSDYLRYKAAVRRWI